MKTSSLSVCHTLVCRDRRASEWTLKSNCRNNPETSVGCVWPASPSALNMDLISEFKPPYFHIFTLKSPLPKDCHHEEDHSFLLTSHYLQEKNKAMSLPTGIQSSIQIYLAHIMQKILFPLKQHFNIINEAVTLNDYNVGKYAEMSLCWYAVWIKKN